jgi:hypothetical protein
VERSTLSHANRLGGHDVLSDVFAALLARRAQKHERGRRADRGDPPSLSGLDSEWSRFSAMVCGVKAHVAFDPDAGRPVYRAMTLANVDDVTAAKDTPIEAGASDAFDLGYCDYAWRTKLDDAGWPIVTRFKTNTPLEEARTTPIPAGSDALSDRIGFLPARQANSRKTRCKFRRPRSACAADRQGLAHPHQRSRRIGAGDRRSLQAPLANRTVVERGEATLRIKHFVRRLAVALIAHLLAKLAHEIEKTKHGLLDFTRLPRANITHRRDFTRLGKIRRRPPSNPTQPAFDVGDMNRTPVAQGRA